MPPHSDSGNRGGGEVVAVVVVAVVLVLVVRVVLMTFLGIGICMRKKTGYLQTDQRTVGRPFSGRTQPHREMRGRI